MSDVSKGVRIAQISDLHVRRPSANDARVFDEALRAFIPRLNALEPDLVIATGDLTNTGDASEYQRLLEHLKALAPPYVLLPGNHDNRDALRHVFHDHAHLFENPTHISYAVDLGAVRIVALDSTQPGRAGGYLDPERLEWLRSQLQMEPRHPVLLALHHPPFRTGVWPMDWLGFANVGKLQQILAHNSQVRRVVSGHVHSTRTARWGGTFLCTSPSTRTQRLLIREPGQLPAFRRAHGGFLLHEFAAHGDVTTFLHRTDGLIEELR